MNTNEFSDSRNLRNFVQFFIDKNVLGVIKEITPLSQVNPTDFSINNRYKSIFPS